MRSSARRRSENSFAGKLRIQRRRIAGRNGVGISVDQSDPNADTCQIIPMADADGYVAFPKISRRRKWWI